MRLTIVAALLAFSVNAAAQVGVREGGYWGEFYAGLGGGSYNQDLGRVTDGGFAWSARFGADLLRYVGVELYYQGLSTSVNTLFTAGGVAVSGFTLVQSVVSADAKINYPILTKSGQVKPYVLAGVGWSHIFADQPLSAVGVTTDDAFAAPFGAGVTFTFFNNLALDGRFTYNLLTGERSRTVRSGDSWTAIISVGARFPF
jgi:hypothetical protein